jgi:hypothetical protein
MMNLVFFLEEPSAREMLIGLLPRLINTDDYVIRYVVFEGKSDLEKNIERKIRAWKQPDTQFVILRDQDSGDCKLIKQGLLSKCKSVHESNVLVRIACRELESWYPGELSAIERGLEIKNLSRNKENINSAILITLINHQRNWQNSHLFAIRKFLVQEKLENTFL